MTHLSCTNQFSLQIAGEQLILLPQRALYWPRERTLFIADLHLGKAAAFRAHAVAIPRGTSDEDLTRLNKLMEETGAQRLVVLGDFFHSRSGRTTGVHQLFSEWRAQQPGLHIILVRGNHDRHAGDPLCDWDIECWDAPAPMLPFELRHHPEDGQQAYALCGHVHPGIRLQDRTGLSERLRCFVFAPRYAVLPAFGSFTGMADWAPTKSQRVFVIADEEIIEVSASG